MAAGSQSRKLRIYTFKWKHEAPCMLWGWLLPSAQLSSFVLSWGSECLWSPFPWYQILSLLWEAPTAGCAPEQELSSERNLLVKLFLAKSVGTRSSPLPSPSNHLSEQCYDSEDCSVICSSCLAYLVIVAMLFSFCNKQRPHARCLVTQMIFSKFCYQIAC